MRAATRYMFVFAAIGFFCVNAYGDGKMYIPDRIPANIPYQRAFLIYHEGIETLILQSKYELKRAADVNSIGWVVPVPAVPEIASVDADRASWFFRKSSMMTRPALFEIHNIIFLLIIVIFLASVIISIGLLPIYPFLRILGFTNIKWEQWNGYFAKMAYISFALLILLMIFGLFSTAGSKQGGVEVVKAEQVGIYDVKAIKSKDANEIVNWLEENGFDFNEKDVDVFDNYAGRQWCFVTAKVRQDLELKKQKIVYGRMVTPLILKFKSDKAIYPLALTSVIGTETEVLLYTLSGTKLSCNERMKLRYSGKTQMKGIFDSILTDGHEEAKSMFDNLPEDMIMCKFKSRLTAEQMKEDLEFENATDNEPYRESRIIW